MNNIQPPNWQEARDFLSLIFGESDPVVCFQVFDDTEAKDRLLAGFKHGRLTDPKIRQWLTNAAENGCGVYFALNVMTAGEPRQGEFVKSYVAVGVDLDKVALPEMWGRDPDIINHTSTVKGLKKHHCFWLVEPGDDIAAWADAQARGAAYYGGDPSMTKWPSVFRVPGFYHQKGKPFRVHTIKADATSQFDRPTLAEWAADHECDYMPPGDKAISNGPSIAPDDWDKPRNVEAARTKLAKIKAKTGDRNNSAYRAAALLNDHAISPEMSLELLREWNDAQDDPLPDHELKHVIKSAPEYKQSPAGVAATIEAKDDFDEDVDPIWLDDKQVSFENQSVAKLNNVDSNNVGHLFRKVNLNGKMRVAYWGKSELDKTSRTLQFWTFAEFRNALIAKHVMVETRVTDKKGNETKRESRIPLAEWFLNNPSNYMFDGVTLQPEQSSDTPDAINLWRGFSVEPSENGSWDLLRAHVRDNVAKGKKDRFNYIMRWIAWAIQNPDKPCEVALILKSPTHGTGKGVLLRTIRKLFGAHGMQISKTGLLTGRFNAHLAMTCFLFVDEMTIGDNKETATLNSTLTEDVLAVEPKGIDAYMIPNHVKVAAASNQEHVVYVADTDRRFAVFDVGDDHANDHPYFSAISKQLDEGGLARMLHDLQHMDLNGWHPRQDIPDTTERIGEKTESAPPELQWLAGYLDSGVLDARAGGHSDIVSASEFYDRARKLPGLKHWADIKFAAFLKKWGVARTRGGGYSRWHFPPLADMRAAWREKFPWWQPFDDSVIEWQGANDIDAFNAAEDADFG